MRRERILFFIIALLIFAGLLNSASAQTAINTFDLNPKVVPVTSSQTVFQMTLTGTIDVAQFNSDCGSNVNEFSWHVYEVRAGPDRSRASGTQAVNRTSSTLSFSINRAIIFNTTGMELLGRPIEYYVRIYCPNSGAFSSSLADSDRVQITFGSANLNYACVAANNRPVIYACSLANLSNCSDAPACAGQPCIQINDTLCGQAVPPGAGGGPIPPGQPPGPGASVSFTLEPPTQIRTLTDLARAVARFLLQIAIPIAVIIIIWAGLLFLTSQGNKDQIVKARKALLYAVIGLAIILIGQGFVTLVRSVLDLGR